MISFEPLRKTMKEKGVKSKDLVAVTGINAVTLTNTLNGHSIPQTLVLEKICNALDCGIADVVEWREDEVQ